MRRGTLITIAALCIAPGCTIIEEDATVPKTTGTSGQGLVCVIANVVTGAGQCDYKWWCEDSSYRQISCDGSSCKCVLNAVTQGSFTSSSVCSVTPSDQATIRMTAGTSCGWTFAPPNAIQGAACNDLVDGAPPVAKQKIAGSPTIMPAGGAIADGRYFLTDISSYQSTNTGPSKTTEQQTLVVNGNTWQFVGHSSLEMHGTVAVSTSGTKFSSTVTCPPPEPDKTQSSYTHYEYSATPTQFRLFNITVSPTTGETHHGISTYTRQP